MRQIYFQAFSWVMGNFDFIKTLPAYGFAI